MPVCKVSFLVPDIGAPTVGAAVRLARSLAGRFPVEIVGPDVGRGVCSMYQGEFSYKVVPCPRLYRFPDYLWESRRLDRAVEGDVIVAVKAFADTVPVALRAKRGRGAKVLVYLDEWDGALFFQLSWGKRIKRILKDLHHPMEDIYYPLVERLIPRADGVISTSRFLQKRFGGSIVPLGVDAGFFKPQPREETEALKKQLGLEGCRLVVFGGVVRPHKGIETILEALALLGDSAFRLLVVGPVTDHVRLLITDSRFSKFLQCAGAPPEEKSSVNWDVHQRMPAYLGAADILAVPLADTLLARSQMPCKVFEAMAMGKPIVGNAVSDLPEVLDGCGWVVPPGDPARLAETIRHILGHPAEAAARGAAAREKCLHLYTREKTGEALAQIIEGVVR